MNELLMPLLDIAIAQPSFLHYMRSPRVRISVNSGVLSGNFIHGNGNRFGSLRKLVQNPENANFSMVPDKLNRARFVIKAVATLQPKRSLHNKDAKKGYESLSSIPEQIPKLKDEAPSEDPEVVGEREKLRRQRISKANKGNKPWNLGRKHSPETLKRIRERTRLAMQDPKVKMKLANLGHAQSNETRKKIGVGVQLGWQRRRKKLLVQETCVFNWQNLVAEAARQGHVDEEELQWDSFEKLNQQLQQEWIESLERRKAFVRPKGNKRAPKSLEQRRKIAASIAAKWADPEYRNRVYSGLAKYHGSPVGIEKRRRPPGEGRSTKRSPKKDGSDEDKYAATVGKASIRQPKPKKSKGPMYKDPLAKAKFEMIKNIRARRSSTDMKQHEALERAKSLITEAEKAAKALEVAAASSPIAQASLLETRTLIAEAVQLIQSLETEQSMPIENNRILIPIDHGDDTKEQKSSTEEDQIAQSHHLPPNGTLIQLSFPDSANIMGQGSNEMPAFGLYNVVGKPNPREAMDPPENNGSMIKVNGTQGSELSINGRTIKINGEAKQNGALLQATNPILKTPSTAAKKRWVRGRLVEVVDGE